MSKRETFEKNIKSITRSRTLKRALQGWKVDNLITLPINAGMSSCELCGTPFREGAVIHHDIAGKKKTTITVGGTCLQTIIKESFAEPIGISHNRAEVKKQIKRLYGSLVDPGTWINWIVDNAPHRLAPLVAKLKYLGAVSVDSDLLKLVKFHDANRRYPRESLIPEAWGASLLGTLPKHITLDEARAFRKKILAVPSSFLASCKRVYKSDVIDGVSVDPAWNTAWESLTLLNQSLAVALCSISDNIHDLGPEIIVSITKGLKPLTKPFKLPLIAWNQNSGLGLLEKWASDDIDEVETWLWHDEDYCTTDFNDWYALSTDSNEFVQSVELVAFWDQPVWYKGKQPQIARTAPSKSKKLTENVNVVARHDIEMYLKSFLPIQQLLDIARFRLRKKLRRKSTFAEQLNWLKDQLDTKDISWEDFIWKVERCSTNPDAQYQVDVLVKSIAAHVYVS